MVKSVALLLLLLSLLEVENAAEVGPGGDEVHNIRNNR